MAASKKKRVEEQMEMPDQGEPEEENSDDVDEDDMESEEELQTNEQVQMDFEARMPEDSDFHGIKSLLQQLFLKAHVNVSELTDTIISQNYVGSVVKQSLMPDEMDDDDDDDSSDDTVLALNTVINITERKELECVKQIRSLVQDRCQHCAKEQTERLSKLLADPDKHVGFFVSERFINLPPNLAVPMFESLLKEMDKARKKNMKYDFAYYLMISKTFQMKPAGQSRVAAGAKQDLFFTNSEEELFRDESVLTFSYSVVEERDGGVEGKWSSDNDMEPFRTVMIIPADKLPGIIDKIQQELAST